MHNIYVRGTVWKDAEGEPYFERMILPLAPRGSNTAEVVCFALPFLRPADYPTGLSVQEGIKHYLTNLDKRLKKTEFKRLPVMVAAHFYAHGALIQEQEHSERLVVGGQDMVEVGAMGKTTPTWHSATSTAHKLWATAPMCATPAVRSPSPLANATTNARCSSSS